MKKLIFHMGLHKTGTTSIQSGCRQHRNVLAEAGYFYPLPIFESNDEIPENHGKLFQFLFQKINLYNNGKLIQATVREAIRDKFTSRITQNKNNLILSSEYASLLTKEELGNARNYFSDLGYDIKPFCVIRKSLSWLNSSVSERVAGKWEPNRVTLPEAIQEFSSKSSIMKGRIEAIKGAFPETKFVPFSKLISNKLGPIGYFFEELGIDASKLHGNLRFNEGVSDQTVRLASFITQSINNRNAYSALIRKLPALLQIPGDKFYLRESEIAPLLPLLTNENNWLKETFGKGFYDEEIKFSNEPVTLNDEERQYLIDHFSNVEEPIRSIVKKYLAEH